VTGLSQMIGGSPSNKSLGYFSIYRRLTLISVKLLPG